MDLFHQLPHWMEHQVFPLFSQLFSPLFSLLFSPPLSFLPFSPLFFLLPFSRPFSHHLQFMINFMYQLCFKLILHPFNHPVLFNFSKLLKLYSFSFLRQLLFKRQLLLFSLRSFLIYSKILH